MMWNPNDVPGPTGLVSEVEKLKNPPGKENTFPWQA